jgi:CSLREA domain-containing protein
MDLRLVCSLGLAALLAGTVQAQGANLNVDSTQDSPDAKPGDGQCLSKAGGCTLRAAIEEANATTLSDTINLPPGTYTLTVASGGGPDFAQSGRLFVNGEVQILGGDAASTIIDGGGKVRVFETEKDSTVSLMGVTIRNGLADGASGGGILNRGNLKLADVVLTGNRAKGDPLNAAGNGAGLSNADTATATLLNVRVTDNTADGRGGGIANDGSVQLMNSTVSGNASLTDDGGGIQNDGTLSILLSEVDSNRAKSGAGINNVKGEVKLTDSTLASNNASSNGGALFNSGTVTAVNTTISGNTAGQAGGAIANRASGKIDLNNVTIAANTATSGGGGIENAATATISAANSILATNVAANGADCAGVLTSKGYNLIQNAAGCTISGDPAGNVLGQDAKLAVLAQNDGPTRTQALGAGSPAIDAANPKKPTGADGSCARADQRGVARDQVGRCDIGAFEVGATPAR